MRVRVDIIAGIIFGFLALVHLARLICPFDVTIANHQVPLWASAVFFVVGGLMSAWLFRSREA